MAHLATRLTEHVELGAVRRDVDDLEVVRTDGGSEVRNTRWSQSLLAFDVSFPTATRDDPVFLEVRNAYRATRAGLHSFKFRDWTEYQAVDEVFGECDGATTVFPLVKRYTFGAETHERRIFNPVSPVSFKVNGAAFPAGYSVDYTTGIVTFTAPPAADAVLTWSGEFDVPVRFDGELTSTGVATHLEHHETITLLEVRL